MRSPLILLLLAALMAHGAGLRNGFVYDDHRFVTDNPALLAASPLELARNPALQTSDEDRDIYRPLRAWGHAWDLRRWGAEPFGFHLHSLLVHLLNVVLTLMVLRRLVPGHETAARLGALALAVHPLGAEAVGWVTSRGDLYAVTFGLLALGAHARAEGSARVTLLITGALAAALATLGKESAAVLPGVAALHVLLVRRRGWAGVAALGTGVATAAILRHVALQGASPVQTQLHGGSIFAQAGWALNGTGRTLLHLVWPDPLMVEYPQHEWMDGLGPWLSAPSLLAAAVIAVGLVLAWARALPAFPLAWILLAYLPSSSLLVTLRSLVNDRAAYPLLPAFGLLLGLGIEGLVVGRRPRWATPMLAALALVWIGLCIPRTRVFESDATLWTDVLGKAPQSVKAHLGLAWVARDRDVGAQRDHLAQAARLAPAHTRLSGLALLERGQFTLVTDKDPAAAAPLLEQAWRTLKQSREKPGPSREETEAAVLLAWSLWSQGQAPRARDVLVQAEQDGARGPAVALAGLLQSWLAWRDGHSGADLTGLRASLEAARAVAPGHPLVMALDRELGP